MDSERLASIVNYLYTGSGRQYGSTASMVEKHRFSGQKAVLFHPQSGAFPNALLYVRFRKFEFSQHSTTPIKC